LVDDVVLVSDGQMLAAMRCLALEEHVAAEPAGAAATAALLFGDCARVDQIVVVVTGGNVTGELLGEAVRSGLAIPQI
jgi:threonine dehydratase